MKSSTDYKPPKVWTWEEKSKINSPQLIDQQQGR